MHVGSLSREAEEQRQELVSEVGSVEELERVVSYSAVGEELQQFDGLAFVVCVGEPLPKALVAAVAATAA